MTLQSQTQGWGLSRPEGRFLPSCLPEAVGLNAIPYELSKRMRRGRGRGYAIHQGALREYDGLQQARNVITVFLGEPSSVAAFQNGGLMEFSDSFAPTGGVLSETGCGPIDSSVVFQLMADGVSLRQIEDVLTRQSGFKALAGGRFDLKSILTRKDVKAKAAKEILRYQILKEIGACLASLGGVDALLFISEECPAIKDLVYGLMRKLRFLGVKKGTVVKRASLLTARDSLIKVYFMRRDPGKRSPG